MTDTCTHCTVRGDINECHATPCSTHISWYAQQQQAEIERLHEVIDRAAKAWMSLEPPVAWEGDVADAMAAGVAEIERLKGMKPAPLSGVIPTGTLPRYMVRWNGPTEPLAVPSDDGYWTPWHVAQAEIERLTKDNDKLRGALETEKECIDGDLTSWRAASPKRITAIKDLEWRQELIRAALAGKESNHE